jgi:hypothetical protein
VLRKDWRTREEALSEIEEEVEESEAVA